MLPNPYMNPFINQFPYMDAHEMNLDWIIKTCKMIIDKMNGFEAANTVEFKGVWSITSQYTKWSIVLDTVTSNMMISVQPVPVGIDINNSDYWILVAPFKVDTSLNVNSYNAISNKAVTTKFNTIDNSISDLNDEDDTLHQRITDEGIARSSADQNLADAIATTNEALADETNARALADSTFSDAISDINDTVDGEIAARTASEALINARIDNIVALPEGSTQGDAELMDIRVGLNGVTYASAGDAVREQFETVDDTIDGIYDGKILIPYIENPGYVGSNGAISSQTIHLEIYTNQIPVTVDEVLTLDLKYPTTKEIWFAVCTYDSNEDFIERKVLVNNVEGDHYNGEYTIPEGVSFVVFTFRTYGTSKFIVTRPWDMKTDIDGLETVKDQIYVNSKNLINLPFERALYTQSGAYQPAAPTKNTNASIKPEISVTGGLKYTLSRGNISQTGVNTMYLMEFDSSGTRIKFTSTLTDKITVTADANTVKMGIMIYNSNCTLWTNLVPEWIQLEQNDVATYYLPGMILNDGRIDSRAILDANKNDIIDLIYGNQISRTVQTIAHRGDILVAPQCTAPSYIEAKKHGLQIAENDLTLSADGYLIVWHDTSLAILGNLVDINGYLMYTNNTDYFYVDPTDNTVYTWDGSDYVESSVPIGSLTRCDGSNYGVNSDYGVRGLNLNILKRIDFGVYKSEKYKGTQILTFDEWVLLCKELGMDIYIDRKLTYTNELLTMAANIVKKYGMGDHASWLGLTYSQIDLLRTIIPGSRCGTLQFPTAALIERYEPYNTGRGFFFNGDAKNGMTEGAIQLGLNAGFEVEVWYVSYGSTSENDILDVIRAAVSYGVTGITLDHYRVDEAFSYLLE